MFPHLTQQTHYQQANQMHVTSHGVTDIGLIRENNEDRFAIDADLGLHIVCDGMGGHAGGEVAASMAITSVVDYFRSCRPSQPKVDSWLFAATAKAAIKRASREIHFVAARDFALNKMGTTLTMLMLADEQAHIANVGDSRAYLIRRGSAHLLTTDQTIRNELLAQGYAADDPLATGRFSRMLTHCVGEGESVVAETLSVKVQPGDRFLLCTDGLSQYFDDAYEVAKLAAHGRPQSVTRELVNLAKRRGGSDNITAIIIAIDAPPKASTVVWRQHSAASPNAQLAFAG